MSMSAEMILLNCEKQFNFIKNDISLLIKYINEVISECEQINHADFYKNKMKQLIKKLEKEKKELDDNLYEKKISLNNHVNYEIYNEVKEFAEKKRNLIASLKSEAYFLKKDIIQNEQKSILESLSKNNFDDLNNLQNLIMDKYKIAEDKQFIKNLFNNNKHILINKNKQQILDYVLEEIQKYKNNKNQIIKEINNFSYKNYLQDQDFKEIIEISNEQLNNLNFNNKQDIENHFIKFSQNIENEFIRKDNIIKIVKAIKEIGYLVDQNNIRKLKEKNMILIHGEKPTGEYVDFAVRLDGSFVYNWEGFEGHEHDVDAQAFIKKIKEYDLYCGQEFKKVYREPKYVAKNVQKNNLKNKKNYNN